MLGASGSRAGYIPASSILKYTFFKGPGKDFFVWGGSKYIYVGPFPLKWYQVLDLFTKQRIVLENIERQQPIHFPMHQLIMPMLLEI